MMIQTLLSLLVPRLRLGTHGREALPRTPALALAIAGIALLWLPTVHAADAIQPGAVELYPTPSAVGIEARYTGDDNQNATASFVWRKQGEEPWRNGVDPTIDRKRRLIWGSIWPLAEGEMIEVKFAFSDPDAPGLAPTQQHTATRRLIAGATTGRTLHVAPAGDDSNPGTRQQPFKTLAQAAAQAQPGDTVYADSGTYAEGNLFQRLKGTAEKPITFAAAPGAKPILDSSVGIDKDSGAWEKLDGNLFATRADFTGQSLGYVAQDGMRMFRYSTLADLKSDKDRAKRAWYFDSKEKKLYVRTGTDAGANGHAYRVSRHDYALHMTGSQYVTIRGFTLRHYGNTAVRLSEGARHCTVADCTIHNVPCGFFLKSDTTRDIAIWRNEIFEPGLADFSWGAIKGSDYPRQGVMFNAGRGISVCHNRMHGWFDCICPESWKNPDKLELNRDCDVMFNELYNVGDDAIEADGGGVNLRIHGNRIRNAHTAISLAPVERGPLYCTRNDASFRGLMFKLNVAGCTSLGWTFCYHNSGYCLMKGEDGGTAISFPPGIPCANKVFKNNALVGNEWSVRAGQKGYILDHNCYWHVPGKTPRRFQWEKKTYNTIDDFRKAVGQEQHGQYADPLFADCPNLGKFAFGKEFLHSRLSDDPLLPDGKSGDLRLQPGSPCIDRGALIRGINDDYRGQGPDVGAFEL